MKFISLCVIYCFFGVTIVLIAWEMGRAFIRLKYLDKNEIDVPKDSATYKLASKDTTTYINSQEKATRKKLKNLLKDLVEQIIFLSLSIVFIIPKVQHFCLNFCERRLNILKRSYFNFRKSEINFLNAIFSAYLLFSLWISDLYSTKYDFIKYFIGLLFCYVFVFPLVIIFVLLLIRKLGIQIILACYVAFLIKLVPDILTVDNVEKDNMKKVPSKKFPDKIQNILRHYKLDDSVFTEKEPSENMNAALIGYGDEMRIEIYGDMEKLNKQKIYSVFLHELGHAFEHSLFKKACVYISLVCFECGLMIYLYKFLASKYSHEKLNVEVSFLLLALIYKMNLRQWLMLIYKFTSQRSEMVSDFFAKSFNYQTELGKVLYQIGIDSHDYLNPTILYNLLRSGHPSIYDRVEYLLK